MVSRKKGIATNPKSQCPRGSAVWNTASLKRIEVLVALMLRYPLIFQRDGEGEGGEAKRASTELTRRRVNVRHLPLQRNEIINVIKWNINFMHNE